MTSEFNQSTKQIADELIALSAVLKDKMETWADVFTRRPDGQADAGAGFISTQSESDTLEVVIDVQAQANANSGVMRTKAIETKLDSSGNERFNGISLNYGVDYAAAQKLVEKAGAITREDIAQLLHDDTSQVTWILISDETGKDSATQELLGKRYDLESDELSTLSEDTSKELMLAMDKVLGKLNQTAKREASA
ncbi:MAG: hypothetical protein ACQR33_05760 [Candidatus Saccharibacteria bacterium]